MRSGFVKLYRSSIDSTVMKDPVTWLVWSYLLLSANWKDSTACTGGKDVTIPRGSLILSTRKLAPRLSITRQSLRTALAYLESTHRITRQSTHQCTIVTICNYEEYQSAENGVNPPSNQGGNPRSTHDQPTTNPRLTLSEESKNGRTKERKNIQESAREGDNSAKAKQSGSYQEREPDIEVPPLPNAGRENSGIAELTRLVVSGIGRATDRDLTDEAQEWEPIVAKMVRQGLTEHRQLKVLDWYVDAAGDQMVPTIGTKWNWKDKFSVLEKMAIDASDRKKVYVAGEGWI